MPSPGPTRPVILASMWFYLGFGLLLAIPGPALEAIRGDFGVSYTGAALAISAPAYGYVVGTLLGGPLSDRVGRRLTLTGAAALMTAGVVGVGLSPTITFFVMAGLAHGIAFGVADPTVTALVGEAAGARAGRALNISQLTFGLGSLLGPLLVGAFVSASAGWRPVYWVAGGALGVAVVVFARLTYPARVTAALPIRRVVRVMAAPVPALLGLAIALYFGSQIGVGGFLAAFLQHEHELPQPAAASAVGVFWTGLLFGRLLGAWLSDRFDLHRVAQASLLATAGLIALAATAPWLGVALVAAGLAGVAIGPLFPSILAIGVRHSPGAGGAVAGAMLSIGGLGVIAFSPLVGGVVDAAGVRAGLLVVPMFLIVGVAATGAAGRLARPVRRVT